MHNMAYGNDSVALGGLKSNVNAKFSTGIAGGSTGEKAITELAAGYQSVVTDSGVEWHTATQADLDAINQGLPWSGFTYTEDHDPYATYVLDKISTAVGYQSTADAPGVIAFGHDKGDVASVAKKWKQKATVEYIKTGDNDYDVDLKYYDANHNEISDEEYYKLANADSTWNDYTQAPIGTEEKTYQSAYYNRLVKAADGRDAHDAVVMEQLTPYTKSDASNIGSNLKTYTVGDDGETITEAKATTEQQKANKDAWGQALGAGTFTTGTSDKATDASTSDQLVTGKTLYNYDKPTGSANYVNVKNTTGQNLSALDAQVKANADALDKPNHNIKYYSVKTAPLTVDGYTNENNDGAQGMGSIAAGFVTHADGIASTVAGSYSGVINSKTAGRDLRGATALSYGTFNINQNTDAAKEHSGVANSIIGQVNMTKDSNAAIIYGAGNTVTNSYRKIDDTNVSEIMQAAFSKNVKKLDEALQKAVPNSGAQVMVMGGGNSVDKTYMTQVTGVGNKVNGQDSTYTEKTSTQYNFIDGFQNELSNGKHDYIIGSNNKVSGESVDKNQSNIIFGDNHKLTGQNNNVIIGSSDTADDETKVSNAVIIGHNAKVSAEGGVAIGSGSQATVAGNTVAGYDAKTGQASKETNATWKATNGAVSIGTADGKVTRQINGLAAGKEETDAVNVAQLKSLQSGLTEDLTGKGLKFAANSGTDYTAQLGSTVKIQGTDKKAGHEYTADNLTTEIDGSGNITILMDKDMSVEKLAVNGKDGTAGHIGLTGPAGTNGKDGTSAIDITVKNGYDGANGINGKNGVDGTSLTRIVYTDNTGEHQVATLEDGLKFKGDDDTVIAKKLNNTMEIIGGAKGDLTEGNIGVKSTKEGKLKVQLAKDLQGITSISNQKTEGDKTTGAKIDLGEDGSVNVNKGKITNVGSGIEKDANGKYTVTDQNKGNAANIGDVQNMVNDAKKDLTDGANGLNSKANVDASNIGSNITVAPIYQKDEKGQDVIGQDGQKVIDQKATEDAEKTARTANENAWGNAIGTGKIEQNNGQLVTGNTVYEYNKPIAKDGKSLNYVSEQNTTGQNLGALDAQVKDNADAITQINTSISTLDQNAVKYDNSSKSKITLGGGEGGTTITNVKNGKLSDDSTEAVNGKQLYNEQQAREAADNAITEKVMNNTNEITKIKNGDFTDTSKTVIKNLAKNAVRVKAGDRIKVDEATDEKTGNKTYTISANNNGTVAKNDGNLISGGTLYNEVHVDKDGTYIKSKDSASGKDMTVAQNLSALDKGLKTTSDLIHTNDKGDTIQIGGSSTATKIDVNGKDGKGRVITGVVTDAGDPNSAANVGYVNGLTAANTQQIYRDMNNAYSRLDTNINRAAAGSNALAALHPLDFDPADKASFAVGYGHYHNANAAAVGAFYQPNANTMVNMGISLGNSDPGFNAGVSFKIGKGSTYNGVSKAEMAQTIHDQAAEISTIKANDAAKDKRIDALEKENQEMKKQIQEILARLNG